MADGKAGRAVLEARLLGFQRHFLGGMSRDLELISSGGGTRPVNLPISPHTSLYLPMTSLYLPCISQARAPSTSP